MVAFSGDVGLWPKSSNWISYTNPTWFMQNESIGVGTGGAGGVIAPLIFLEGGRSPLHLQPIVLLQYRISKLN